MYIYQTREWIENQIISTVTTSVNRGLYVPPAVLAGESDLIESEGMIVDEKIGYIFEDEKKYGITEDCTLTGQQLNECNPYEIVIEGIDHVGIISGCHTVVIAGILKTLFPDVVIEIESKLISKDFLVCADFENRKHSASAKLSKLDSVRLYASHVANNNDLTAAEISRNLGLKHGQSTYAKNMGRLVTLHGFAPEDVAHYAYGKDATSLANIKTKKDMQAEMSRRKKEGLVRAKKAVSIKDFEELLKQVESAQMIELLTAGNSREVADFCKVAIEIDAILMSK